MNIVVIVQARMGSTRLPGKTMKLISGRPILWHVLERIKQSKKINKIIVATTINKEDDIIQAFCEESNVPFFRGSSEDVLDRYYQAAKEHNAEIIVRVTADCPLIDAGILDELIYLYSKGTHDYVSNNNPPSYPHGLDAEVFSSSALEKAWKEAKLPQEREHVTPYIRKNTEFFKLGNLSYKEDFSKFRWTLDYSEDFEVLTRIFSALGKKAETHKFIWKDVLALIQKNPEHYSLNNKYRRP